MGEGQRDTHAQRERERERDRERPRETERERPGACEDDRAAVVAEAQREAQQRRGENHHQPYVVVDAHNANEGLALMVLQVGSHIE